MFLEVNEFSAKFALERGSSAVFSKAHILVIVLFLSAHTFAAAAGPVDCTHLMAWIAGGVAGPKLIDQLQHRGIAFTSTSSIENEFLSAGAAPDLLETLRHQKPGHGDACPAALVKAATLVHQKK